MTELFEIKEYKCGYCKHMFNTSKELCPNCNKYFTKETKISGKELVFQIIKEKIEK